MNRAVIALGSNIKPKENTEAALSELSKAFSLIKKSQFIFTEPVGYKDQPDFLNGSVLIETSSEKAKASAALKKIENKLGRQRNGHKYGPRKIDLDLVLWNGRILDTDIFERDFLKRSVREVLPHVKFND